LSTFKEEILESCSSQSVSIEINVCKWTYYWVNFTFFVFPWTEILFTCIYIV